MSVCVLLLFCIPFQTLLHAGPRQRHSPRAQFRHIPDPVRLEGSVLACPPPLRHTSKPPEQVAADGAWGDRSQHWEIRLHTRIHSKKPFEFPKHVRRFLQWRSAWNRASSSWNVPGSVWSCCRQGSGTESSVRGRGRCSSSCLSAGDRTSGTDQCVGVGTRRFACTQ